MRFNLKNTSRSATLPTQEKERALSNAFKELKNGLDGKLLLDDNLNTFIAEIDIDANSSVRVRNELSVIPTEWVVVDAKNAPPNALARASTNWDHNYLYIQNFSSYSGTFKIRFYAGQETDRPFKNSVLSPSVSVIDPLMFLLMGG